MKEEHIDFRKEFEEFKKELENSKPIFDDESIEFNDFDNLISNSNDDIYFNDLNNLQNKDSNNDLNNDLNENYPNITLETDDILMNLSIKKDYSAIDDLDKRKKEFISDLKAFIDEFESREESDELMKYYD